MTSRIELEEELQFWGHDEEIPWDMFHYLFWAKDSETGEPAFLEHDSFAGKIYFLLLALIASLPHFAYPFLYHAQRCLLSETRGSDLHYLC